MFRIAANGASKKGKEIENVPHGVITYLRIGQVFETVGSVRGDLKGLTGDVAHRRLDAPFLSEVRAAVALNGAPRKAKLMHFQGAPCVRMPEDPRSGRGMS